MGFALTEEQSAILDMAADFGGTVRKRTCGICGCTRSSKTARAMLAER